MSQARIAVITGSSRGIGLATVEEFLGRGYCVFGLHSSQQSLPSGAVAIRTDVADEKSVNAAFERIAGETDRVHVLVNNAAIQVNARLVDTSPEQWDKLMGVNLRGLYLCTRAAHPLLRQAGNAAVINVASVHAVCTSSGIAAYAASKGAIVALTRACALELAEDGIRVNCISPGAVVTDMLRDGLDRGHLSGSNVEAQMTQLASRTPLRRIGTPAEIARAILFLASPETASFITGQNLIADGGALARLSTE